MQADRGSEGCGGSRGNRRGLTLHYDTEHDFDDGIDLLSSSVLTAFASRSPSPTQHSSYATTLAIAAPAFACPPPSSPPPPMPLLPYSAPPPSPPPTLLNVPRRVRLALSLAPLRIRLHESCRCHVPGRCILLLCRSWSIPTAVGVPSWSTLRACRKELLYVEAEHTSACAPWPQPCTLLAPYLHPCVCKGGRPRKYAGKAAADAAKADRAKDRRTAVRVRLGAKSARLRRESGVPE